MTITSAARTSEWRVKFSLDAKSFTAEAKALERELEKLGRFKLPPLGGNGAGGTRVSPEVQALRAQVKALGNEVSGLSAHYRATGGSQQQFVAGMMSARARALELAAGLDKTSNEYARLARTAAQAQRAIDTAQKGPAVAGARFGNVAGMVGAGAMGLVAGFGAMQIAQTGVHLTEIGNQSKRADAALRAMSGGAGMAARNLQSMREATAGGIDDLEAMRLASRVLGLRVAENTSELKSFTENAVILGRVFQNLDAASSVENLAAAIANLSYLRLDQMGLSASEARRRVKELEAAGYDVNEAFKLAVLEQASRKVAELKASGVTAADGMDQLRAGVSNLARAFGEELAPGIDKAAGALGRFLTRAADAGRGQNQQVEALLKTADALEKLGKAEEAVALRRSAQQIGAGALGPDPLKTAQATLEAANATDIYNQALINAGSSLAAFDPELNRAATTAYYYEQAMGAASDEVVTLKDALTAVIPHLMVVRGLMGADTNLVSSSAFMVGLGELTPNAIFQDATESLREATLKADLADTLAPQFAQLMGISLEEAWEHVSKVLGTENVWATNQRNAEAAARAAEAAYKKAAAESKRAWDKVFSEARSAVSSALDLSGTVNEEDFLLDKFGLRMEGPGEIVRRLRSVANEGRQGGGKQWADYYAGLLGLTGTETEDEVKARAIDMIKRIQMGLVPEAIDRDALKAQARAIWTGERNIASIIDEVATELAAEGEGPKSAIMETLGVKMGATLGQGVNLATDTLVGDMMGTFEAQFAAQEARAETLGRAFAAAFGRGALAGLGELDLIGALEKTILEDLEAAASQ